ncbi:homoprotocatechuate degradation operon regulator HpaR [uncultured Bartonella sp.]|uniref:homoprotocatechuate degradation operon regulator HpaR n=1 Tax=uncultured Bartonella sp. TaxID=104108 RepID=UPI0025FC82AC|nr:homoprotocatechuate degradation operon regulator HpaR [uncultured Bartonella sp.]
MTLRSFQKSTPMALLSAREAIMEYFRPHLRNYNLTEQQWRVLRALTAVDEISTTDLADATVILGPSLTRILRDLEDRKLIKRWTCPEDGRRLMVKISKTGSDLIGEVGIGSELIYNEISRAFGRENLSELHKLLGEFIEKVRLAGPVIHKIMEQNANRPKEK